jgi:hypothetical protein
MGTIRQTKRSGNNYWTNILYHNEEGLGSNAANAIDITFDLTTSPDYNLLGGHLVWIKWTSTYNDQVDFWLYSNGLFAIPTSISDYTVYASDATTTIDISNGNASTNDTGSGPDPQYRESHSAFFNASFQSGQTYYATFIAPFTGTYGIIVEGD